VSAVLENNCNSALFAVKYGTPKTLDLLIKVGINMHWMTVLYNALEYPNPEMLRRVLDHVPVTEMFLCAFPNGRQVQMSASDRMICTEQLRTKMTTARDSRVRSVGLI
jgi:hypothetical protein